MANCSVAELLQSPQQKHIRSWQKQSGMETGAAGVGAVGAASTVMEAGERRMKMKVMVALDESDSSFYALKWALDNLFPSLAKEGAATPEATLQTVGLVYLVHVQQPFQQYVYVGPGGAAIESVRKAQEETAAAIVSRGMQMCKDKLIKSETLILNGDPREMICQTTEQMDIDMLVVGNRGFGKIKRVFLGSVSDYCAHHAKCPVLIVKPTRDHVK